MRVLGISGSPRKDHTTDKLVRAVLSGVECETEFVSLAGKTIGPCIACLGCVSDNVCKVKDDMGALRERICRADGLVIGAPNYYSMLNGLTHCFMERFYQFRHREGGEVVGKPAVAVGVGGGMPDAPVQNLLKFFEYHGMPNVGSVCAQGAASCFVCGYGEACRVGAIHMFFPPGTRITEEIIPDLSKQPDKVEEARCLGKRLSDRIREKAMAL